jgi:UDP-sugar pyrophosphorylase
MNDLKQYLNRAKKLLQNNTVQESNITPELPQTFDISFKDTIYSELETIGAQAVDSVCFVLVAGGLGERLGHSNHKLTIVPELLTKKNFISHYSNSIKTLQKNSKTKIPLVIMVSPEAESTIKNLLKNNNYYGLDSKQIKILTQEQVPAFIGNNPVVVKKTLNSKEILHKPCGHGNIHRLIYKNNLTSKWLEQEKKWIIFFQDTNLVFFQNILASLGKSVVEDCDFNFLTTKTKEGDSIGSILKICQKNDKNIHNTINVEYNEIKKFLNKHPNFKKNTKKLSGNTNQFIVSLKTYDETIKKSKGIVPEFVNPKYEDQQKTIFKSPCRIETLMQDFAKHLNENHKVTCTNIIDKIIFYPIKFPLSEKNQRNRKGLPSYCIEDSEINFLKSQIEILRKYNIEIVQNKNTIDPLWNYPKISLGDYFSLHSQKTKELFPNPEKIKISSTSTLILEGENITIKSLTLDGTLIVKTNSQAELIIEDLNIKNKGWVYTKDIKAEKDYLRDYSLKKIEQKKIKIDSPGKYLLNNKILKKTHDFFANSLVTS